MDKKEENEGGRGAVGKIGKKWGESGADEEGRK